MISLEGEAILAWAGEDDEEEDEKLPARGAGAGSGERLWIASGSLANRIGV